VEGSNKVGPKIRIRPHEQEIPRESRRVIKVAGGVYRYQGCSVPAFTTEVRNGIRST